MLDAIACSLDMSFAKRKLQRASLPAVFLKGEGSNGKDSLGSLLELVYLNNRTAIDLAAIAHHDRDHQKFGLSPMCEKTCVNFSSENVRRDISGMETLKKLVTGEVIMMADKGVTQKPHKVKALQIFCTNKDMVISNPQTSIKTRYKLMTLPYEYKEQREIDAAPEGKKSHLRLADPRFADTDWMAIHVVPALFNLMLARFQEVLNRGHIDWSACDHEFEELTRSSSHMRAFLDSGLIRVSEQDYDFTPTVDLYKKYKLFCREIDRAVPKTVPGIVYADGDAPIEEADPKGPPCQI